LDKTEVKRNQMGNKTGRLLLGAVGVAAVLLVGLGRDLIAQQQTRAGAIRVVLQPGGVARQRGNQVVRSTAQKDMAVFFRDVLETGLGGRMRARLDDGSILAVGSQSRLTVTEHNTATQQTSLQLQYGKVRAQVVQKTRPDARFEVHTNTAVAGVLGTDLVVDAFSPIGTSVLCIEGQIEVRNADAGIVGTVILNAGEITFVQQGVVPTPPRPATPDEIQQALEGSGGAAPEAIADIGTGFVTAGDNLVLSGADSFVTGTIVSYQWVITQEATNQIVYNQIQADPELILDTTTLEPGNYLGTLTITTSNNETATTSFAFVVLPSEISNTNPELLIQQMQLAYETLQPNEFMKLFDPVKYSGYAALQQSVEASFRNLSQARVFVRRASGQTFEQGHVAIYQVDFEIHFSTKADPDKTYVTREQATLRLESGSGWLITDVPQGQVGGGGLLAIPGVGNPDEVNTVPTTGNTGTGVPNIIPEGGEVVVLAGGSNTFEIQNTATVAVTITFNPPPGITVTGGGISGTTFTIAPGETLVVIFSAGLNQPAGTVDVPTSITSGNSTLPGPTIPVIVAQLSLSFPGGGGTSATPVPVLLGFSQTATVQVSSTVQTGHTVGLSASGGQVGAAFSPNPVVIGAGSNSGTSTITLTPEPGAAPGADEVEITGSADDISIDGSLFIERIAPFTLTRTSPESLVLTGNQQPPQTGSVSFNVGFNAPFAGPVTITAPEGSGGVAFSPPTLTLNRPGPASFVVTPGATLLAPTPFQFTAAAGDYSQTQDISVEVLIPVDFLLSVNPATLSLLRGSSGQVAAEVTLVSGTAQPVTISVVPESVDASRLSVSGGGVLPEAAGSVSFAVNVQPSAAVGGASFRIAAKAGITTREAVVNVEILPPLQCNLAVSPASLSISPAGSSLLQVSVGYVAGQPGPVEVIVVPSVDANLLEVTGGGAVANAEGTISFTVHAQPNAPPGATAFRVRAPQCATGPAPGALPPEAEIPVSVLGSFSFLGPSAVSVLRGQSTPAALQVVPQEGFNSLIDLIYSCSVPEVSVSGPASLPAGQLSLETLVAASSTADPLSQPTCEVRGTSGSAASSLNFSVLVGSFTITTTAPAPLPLVVGSSAILPVTVTAEQGFSGNVTLAAVATNGIVVTPDTALIAGGNGVASFTLSAGPDAQAGSATVTITGTAEGGLAAQLEHPVLVSNGFLLSSNPATFFLGNSSPLIVNIQRDPIFQGAVELKVGNLPSSIVEVTPPSIVVPAGTNSATFQVVAGAAASLSGQQVSIPITGALPPGVSVASVGRAATGGIARLVAFNATGTLRAPFSLSGGSDLGDVDVGKSVKGTVSVEFAAGFTGTVEVSTEAPSDVTLTGGTADLTASGDVTFTAKPQDEGSFEIVTTAQAGNFIRETTFELSGEAPPPPPPPPPAPSISSFLPPSEVVGASITITGTNFTGATGVTFNGVVASFTVDSDTQITATVPIGATTGPIAVTGPDGTGTSAAPFTVILPPAFSLCVSEGNGPCLTDSDSVNVNSTIPVGLQVNVIPDPGFVSPVTVTVTDGALMQFYALCGTPAGGSYAGGVLTFTLTSPYTSSANFCMSAGVPVAPTSDIGVVFTGTPSSGTPAMVGPTFSIGVPDLTITPSTFTVPAAIISTTFVPGVQLVDIALAAPSAGNVFDLPIQVYITGVGSFLSSTGPFLAPLPASISSPNCGPPTSGLTLAPGSLVTCTVQNVATTPFDSAGQLIVFVTFGPGGGGSVPLGACGGARGVRANCGAQTQRISSGYGTQGAGGAESDGKAGLVIAPDSVQFTPLAPKPGDRVSIQARVENHSGADAEGAKVGLVLNGAPAATLTVSVPAGGTQPVEFVWEAEYYQRLQFEISLQGADGTAQTVPVRNLFVEPELSGTFNQGRSELAILNGECGGFRFALGTQTFCGGSSDLELSPVITGDGQLLVQAFSLNGGVIDLGPQPITGQLTVPEAGYAAKGLLEPGRLYAVESQGKYGLLYVSRIQSDIDPRLARLTRGQSTQVESLDGLLSDRLDDLLDRSRITVVVEWAYLENGSRRFSYGFSGIERGPRPGVIRQPRVPATPQRQ
jgi:hypothetical protein